MRLCGGEKTGCAPAAVNFVVHYGIQRLLDEISRDITSPLLATQTVDRKPILFDASVH